jgi:hypothetical protein
VRNFDTVPPFSYCYELQLDRRLESVANAHTAADLRVRPGFHFALNLKTVGAANDLSDSMPYSVRNGCG